MAHPVSEKSYGNSSKTSGPGQLVNILIGWWRQKWMWTWTWSCSVVSDSFDPTDCSLPGSSIHGIFQEIVLEWPAISFSKRSSQPRDPTQVSHVVNRRFIIWATREVRSKSQQHQPSGSNWSAVYVLVHSMPFLILNFSPEAISVSAK